MSGFLTTLSVFSGLLPIGVACVRYRTFGPVLRVMAWFFVVSGAFDLTLYVISTYLHVRSMPLLHVFSVINLLVLSWLYHKILEGHRLRGAIIAVAGSILVYGVYQVLLPGQLWQFPSALMTVQCVFFIVLSLVYFYQMQQQPEVVAIEHNPLFWVNAGVLLYFASNLFLFLLQSLFGAPEVYNAYYTIHSVANVLAYTLYAAGLLCKPPRLT